MDKFKRVTHVILLKRFILPDQYGNTLAFAANASDLLGESRFRSGITNKNGKTQITDINPDFKGIGSNNDMNIMGLEPLNNVRRLTLWREKGMNSPFGVAEPNRINSRQ
nr:hypothetical protein [Cohnella algarum]